MKPDHTTQKVTVKYSQYILLLAFFTLLAILIVIEGNKLITNEIKEYQNKNTQKVALETRIGNLPELEKQYKDLSGDMEIINEFLPKQDKILDIVAKIEMLANNNKLDLSIKFLTEPASHKIGLQLNTKGYYKETMNFYQSLLSNSFLLSVIGVSFSDPANLKDNISGIFETEVYFD